MQAVGKACRKAGMASSIRRTFLKSMAPALIAGVALAVSAAPVQAADFPGDKPISLVVPFPAGGGTDFIGRLLAAEMGKALKSTIVVENKGGANSNIGTAYVTQARPDGHTLLVSAWASPPTRGSTASCLINSISSTRLRSLPLALTCS